MNWFYQQTRRDQIAIAICGVFLAALLLWLLVLKPLSSAAERAASREAATAASLARVKSLAATLQHHQNTSRAEPRQQVNIANLVDRSTGEAGLRATSMDPSADGQTASVRFDDADLASVLQWLHELESRHQIEIEYLSLLAANEPGQVMATVRLSKG